MAWKDKLLEIKPLLIIASTTFCLNIIFQIHKLYQRSKTDKLDINRIIFQLIFSFLTVTTGLLYFGDHFNSTQDNTLAIVIISITVLSVILNIILFIMFYIYQPNKNQQKPHAITIIVSLALLIGVIAVMFLLSDKKYDKYLCPFICACSLYAIKLVSQLKMNMIHVSTFAVSNVSVMFGIVTDVVLILIYVFNWSVINVSIILEVVSLMCVVVHLMQGLLLVLQYYWLYYERRSDTLKVREHLFVMDLE
jgi:hypothetical protein